MERHADSGRVAAATRNDVHELAAQERLQVVAIDLGATKDHGTVNRKLADQPHKLERLEPLHELRCRLGGKCGRVKRQRHVALAPHKVGQRI